MSCWYGGKQYVRTVLSLSSAATAAWGVHTTFNSSVPLFGMEHNTIEHAIWLISNGYAAMLNYQPQYAVEAPLRASNSINSYQPAAPVNILFSAAIDDDQYPSKPFETSVELRNFETALINYRSSQAAALASVGCRGGKDIEDEALAGLGDALAVPRASNSSPSQ